MNIVVASTNPVKLESVVRGFAPLYGTVHAVGLSVRRACRISRSGSKKR
ncbi:MAG: hypothetical protein UZ13_03177 [Chloroflexi bacterium OLB13]|nr:MAG: hypothetical protein UZ13_03177 [Chloroflexi bacterium OLB13]